MPAEADAWLRELAGLYQPDELFVTTACPDFKLKVRSAELVGALAAGLCEPAGAPCCASLRELSD